MQTEETFRVAREAAREIVENRGESFKPHVVSLSGMVGGRDTNPTVFWGHGVRYTDATSYGGPEVERAGIKFWPDDTIRDSRKAMYIVDGVGMYVAGWHQEQGYVLLLPIGANGQLWQPRRTYVFNTSTKIAALKGAAY